MNKENQNQNAFVYRKIFAIHFNEPNMVDSGRIHWSQTPKDDAVEAPLWEVSLVNLKDYQMS